MLATLVMAGCSINNPLFSVSSDSTDGAGSSSGGQGESSAVTGEPMTSTSLPATSDAETSQTATSQASQTATSVEPQTGGSTDVGVGTSSGSGSDTGIDTGGAVCGDGITEDGEECDDNNNVPGDGCSELCQSEGPMAVCGSGVVEEGEECDDGPDNSDTGNCTNGCKNAVCGDGLVHAGFEECDKGAQNSDTGACTKECKKAYCGDGLIFDGVETCDDGEPNNGTALGECSVDCSMTISKATLKIVVIPGVTGNFSGKVGIAGGDALCEKTVGLGFKILAVDGVSRIASKGVNDGSGQMNWVLQANTGYENVNGKLIGITGAEKLLGVRKKTAIPLVTAIGTEGIPMPVWTGLKGDWIAAEPSCKGWSTIDPNYFGAVGTSLSLDHGFIANGAAKACSTAVAIYCVQQP